MRDTWPTSDLDASTNRTVNGVVPADARSLSRPPAPGGLLGRRSLVVRRKSFALGPVNRLFAALCPPRRLRSTTKRWGPFSRCEHSVARPLPYPSPRRVRPAPRSGHFVVNRLFRRPRWPWKDVRTQDGCGVRVAFDMKSAICVTTPSSRTMR